jgi:Transposase
LVTRFGVIPFRRVSVFPLHPCLATPAAESTTEKAEMKHNQRTPVGKRRKSPSLLERIQPDAAGIDCGEKSHYVAVPRERDPQPVREFRTFTTELYHRADWLAQCGIKTVAMESTGVYWIPLYEILEERGFEVILVNARDVHNVRGRKSDVSDCEWLQERICQEFRV